VPTRTVLILFVLAAGPAWVRAAEIRTFTVTVDGKPAGEFRLIEQKQADGVGRITGESVMQARQGSGWRRCSYTGAESWKDGRLQRLDGRSIDDGKRRQVLAAPSNGKLRILINDQRTDAPADVWTSTFWTVPAVQRETQSVNVLDVETGRVVPALLELAGSERVVVLGQPTPCTHYRVRGPGLEVDLWMDGSERLVRLTTLEDKHRVTMELIKLSR
jgi:uncharacterized protein DUF6134